MTEGKLEKLPTIKEKIENILYFNSQVGQDSYTQMRFIHVDDFKKVSEDIEKMFSLKPLEDYIAFIQKNMSFAEERVVKLLQSGLSMHETEVKSYKSNKDLLENLIGILTEIKNQ